MKYESEELKNAIANSPPGSFRRFTGAGTGMEKDADGFLRSFAELQKQIDRAKEANFLVEEISLLLQVIDFWLRLWIINVAPVGTSPRKMFGALIEQTRELGFETDLVHRLAEANLGRVKAIHHYLVGGARYDDFRLVAKEFRVLRYDAIVYVINNCGAPVNVFDGSGEAGELIAPVAGLTAFLLSKRDQEMSGPENPGLG